MKLLTVGLMLTLLLVGCATSTPLLLTGETVDALGQEVVQTNTAYNTAITNKTITIEQYRTWASFARRFQSAYPLAVHAWKLAAAACTDPKAPSCDQSALTSVTTILTGLKSELITLIAQLAKGATP